MPADAIAEELLDPAFLGRLRTLFVKLRRRRRLKRQGVQQSPSAGHTREFKDHRHYASGDDYRAIDWRLYARLDRLFVRVFEEIQELHVHVLVDASASMAEPHPEKRRDAARLAVALGYLALSSGHRLSLHSLRATGGGKAQRELPPLKGQGHVLALLRHAAQMSFGGEVELGRALASFRPGADRRGVAFLISDAYGSDPFRSAEALQTLRSWPMEAHLVRVHHPDEAAPGLAGELRLEDVEGGAARRLWLTRDDLDRYRALYASFGEELARCCAAMEVGHCAWSTGEAFEDQFISLLERGGALGSGS
jgi:uncharacterized protein (DUF58 family)